jgi:hypothetical protein
LVDFVLSGARLGVKVKVIHLVNTFVVVGVAEHLDTDGPKEEGDLGERNCNL